MEGVKYTGALSTAELASVLPNPQRLERGPVAVIECVQEIPCNPCETSCPHKAITVGADITARPKLDTDKCRGCRLCVSRCPGLAIFVVHANYREGVALVTIPYEYWPLPEAGQRLQALGRDGLPVCIGAVNQVDHDRNRHDGTALVSIEIPQEFIHEVRGIEVPETVAESVVCRCNEVSGGEIMQAIKAGARTVHEVKLATRAGMGLCQGRTCSQLIRRMIAEETGQDMADVRQTTVRPPVRATPLETLAGGDGDA